MKREKTSKIFGKKILSIGLILSCILQFSGCGSKENTENGQELQENNAGPDFVYVGKHQEVDISGGLGASKLIGDTVYFLSGEPYGERGDYDWQAYRLKPEAEEITPTPLPFELGTEEHIEHLCVDLTGNYQAVVVQQVRQETGQDGEAGRKTYFLNCYSPDGALLFSKDITELSEGDSYFSIRYMAVDQEGNSYLCSNGSVNDFSTVWIFDKEGNGTGKLPCETWANALFTLPNGKVAAVMREDGGGGSFREIEAEKGKFGKTYGNLPEVCSNFAVISDNTVLMAGNDKVYQYDITTEICEEMLSLRDCDIDGNKLCGLGMLGDGRLLAVCQGKNGEVSKAELVYLTKKTPEEAAEESKETIVLGVMFFSGLGMTDEVFRFNQTSEKYRIEVVSYGEEDYEAGKMRLDAELVSGSGPDIVWINASDMEAYAKQGILEDLYPYMDAEETMGREDFVESVLAAFETDGKLSWFSPDFLVGTMIGRRADVGEEPGWTMEDLIALAESKPEGTELFLYGTKRRVLESFFYGSMDRFINWETGECSFDDGTFEKLLAFADEFPKEVIFNEEESNAKKLQDGKLLLVSEPVAGVDTYQMYLQLFGEPITCIGYPTDEGSGSYILPAGPAVGINAGSKNKEGAWEFVKQLLSWDYQSECAKLTFPVLREALDAKLEENMTPEYREIDGEQVEQPKFDITYDDRRVELYAATEGEVDAVRTLIENAGRAGAVPEEITNLILEEADAFFEGQKSAGEVAGIIQSRVQIFVNENR